MHGKQVWSPGASSKKGFMFLRYYHVVTCFEDQDESTQVEHARIPATIFAANVIVTMEDGKPQKVDVPLE
jgi:hypothetical protein